MKRRLLILGLFAVLTLLMTYPQVLHLSRGLKDLGDPLLNSWILSWNIHKIVRLDFGHFFDTNIFYPHQQTLAYSEYLLPQSLAVLPVWLVFKNPVLAHNLAFLLAFLTSGLGMYALARYLVRNDYAAVIAGIIFAFSPFMFAHLAQIQVATAGGLPLALLYLHKFFETGRRRDILLFTLFYVVQFLANGYYGIYLSLFSGLLILVWTIQKKSYRDRRFWANLALFVLIALVCLGPFFSHYLHARNDMGFSREMGASTSLGSFLATVPFNRLYGKITAPLFRREGVLFPGLIVVVLAALGLLLSFRRKKRKGDVPPDVPWIYAAILVLAFLFTLGPPGPYMLLYKYVPGFNGLRALSRIHIFVMLSLSILAAIGVRRLFSVGGGLRKNIAKAVVVLLILLEYASFPVPLQSVPVGKEIPEVYPWLARQPDDIVLIELPLPEEEKYVGFTEGLRVYHSAYHWKKMVNGYSGYFPPIYYELCRRWRDLPIRENIKDLRILGVNTILLHTSEIDGEDIERIMAEWKAVGDEVQTVAIFGKDQVLKVKPGTPLPSGTVQGTPAKPLIREGWTADSSVNRDLAALALDGSLATRWESGPQKSGVSFTLDLGKRQPVQGISLKLGKSHSDYPRGYIVEISPDGVRWEQTAAQEKTVIPILAYMKPKDLSVDVFFDRKDARYIRITDTGEDPLYYWSIHEIEVYQ
jgi:hypothetical protein